MLILQFFRNEKSSKQVEIEKFSVSAFFKAFETQNINIWKKKLFFHFPAFHRFNSNFGS